MVVYLYMKKDSEYANLVFIKLKNNVNYLSEAPYVGKSINNLQIESQAGEVK